MEPEPVLGLLGAEELVVVGGGALVDGRESFRPVSTLTHGFGQLFPHTLSPSCVFIINDT